ncbi:uncharacterized protein LOC135312013 [Phalacrocorax carbo]|uniref:uncharacterized protein LOC135312013 n=1 Tax=Phalacrocorax carbo TaxID=9209 RepID=UPI0031193C6B
MALKTEIQVKFLKSEKAQSEASLQQLQNLGRTPLLSLPSELVEPGHPDAISVVITITIKLARLIYHPADKAPTEGDKHQTHQSHVPPGRSRATAAFPARLSCPFHAEPGTAAWESHACATGARSRAPAEIGNDTLRTDCPAPRRRRAQASGEAAGGIPEAQHRGRGNCTVPPGADGAPPRRTPPPSQPSPGVRQRPPPPQRDGPPRRETAALAPQQLNGQPTNHAPAPDGARFGSVRLTSPQCLPPLLHRRAGRSAWGEGSAAASPPSSSRSPGFGCSRHRLRPDCGASGQVTPNNITPPRQPPPPSPRAHTPPADWTRRTPPTRSRPHRRLSAHARCHLPPSPPPPRRQELPAAAPGPAARLRHRRQPAPPAGGAREGAVGAGADSGAGRALRRRSEGSGLRGREAVDAPQPGCHRLLCLLRGDLTGRDGLLVFY